MSHRAADWGVLDEEALRDSRLCDELRHLMEECGDFLLFHDPVWLGAGIDAAGAPSARPSNEVYVSRSADGPIGYAPFTISSRPLRFAVGELILYRHRLRSMTLTRDIVTRGGPEQHTVLIGALLDTLAERLPPNEGIFLDGVATDSALYQFVLASSSARGLLVIRLGDVFQHHFAELPARFADYETQLGSHSRVNLRRRRKKLVEYIGGEMRTQRFTAIDGVAGFLADAQKISRTTYQWRLLGLGLRDADDLRAKLSLAARNGWLRSYILYCRGEPVAFMLGYLYRRTYHYMDVGFDPAWAKWGVGSILQMEVMKDLIEDPNRPEIFDFSTGFGDHKARFGNSSRPEINLLLLQDGPRNRLLVAAYALTRLVDKHASRWLEKAGVKASIKRWLRRIA